MERIFDLPRCGFYWKCKRDILISIIREGVVPLFGNYQVIQKRQVHQGAGLPSSDW
jgi:hypothetical protein